MYFGRWADQIPGIALHNDPVFNNFKYNAFFRTDRYFVPDPGSLNKEEEEEEEEEDDERLERNRQEPKKRHIALSNHENETPHFFLFLE